MVQCEMCGTETGSPKTVKIEGAELDVCDDCADFGTEVQTQAVGLERTYGGLLAVTGVLMTSYLGTQAQAVGLDRVYGGVVGRADRLAIIGATTAVAAVLPAPLYGLTAVGWLLVFLAVVGHLTALQRFYYSMAAVE